MELSNIKHDLKRNLAAIRAGTELIKRGKDSNYTKIIEEMSLQSERTLKLLEKLFTDFDIKNRKEEK